MGKNQDQEDGSDRVSRKLYLTSKLREDMDKYVETKGYQSWNDMMRTAFMFLKQIDPPESNSEEKPITITDRLSSIEAKLDDLTLLKEKLELEETLVEGEISQADYKRKEIPDSELEEINNFDTIRKAIIKELKDAPDNEMKEFVLIPYLRKKFPEEAIWATMLKMEQNKEIKFLDESVIKLLES